MFYSREFELDLIAYILKNPLFLRQHKDKISKIKYQDKFLSLISKELMKCVIDYNTVPKETELKKSLMDLMNKNERFNSLEVDSVQETIGDIFNRDVTAVTGYAVTNFLVQEEVKALTEQMLSLSGEDVLKRIREFEVKISKLGHLNAVSSEDLGMNLFSKEGLERAEELLTEYNSISCIPSTYERWDQMLQGGFRKGELAVLIAPTGVGKTGLLLNLGLNFLKSRNRVVYLVLDNLEGEILTRTVGCVMDKDISQPIDPSVAIEDLRASYKDQYEDLFWFKHYNPRELNKSKLESYLEKLKLQLYELDKANGVEESLCGTIDIIIIDYMDMMISESGASEFWISAEHLSQEIKAVLKSQNILGITATQGGTAAMQADTIKLYMAQGAKSRFNAPDLIFSISQTEDEKKATPTKFRLCCLKARRARTNYEIPFLFHKEKQKIMEDPSIDGVLSVKSDNNHTQGATTQDGKQAQEKNDYAAELAQNLQTFL